MDGHREKDKERESDKDLERHGGKWLMLARFSEVSLMSDSLWGHVGHLGFTKRSLFGHGGTMRPLCALESLWVHVGHFGVTMWSPGGHMGYFGDNLVMQTTIWI